MSSRNQCEDCGMSFENSSELANHKKKFCVNSKYGGIDELQKNFQEASKNKDLSKFGKLSLAMQSRNYDFQKNQQNTSQLDEEYRKIIKKIEDEKNLKTKLDLEKQKAFRQLQALQKQQQELIIDDKRNNLQHVIKRRQALAREQEELQKQIKQYQNKKRQWEKSQVKARQIVDQPYEQGRQIGKINFQRQMLEEKKQSMQQELNAKRRQKQKLEQNLLKMSTTDIQPVSKASQATVVKFNKSNAGMKAPQLQPNDKSQYVPREYDYSKLNNERGRPQTESSQVSKMSSYLSANALDGTQKILKFNLNKEGKSQQDKLIEAITAQEYDDLLILSKLPKGSQLYNVKMKQYAQLSKKRMEVQQKAQKQRVQKMKRQFQFEKIILEKEKQNAQWVNDHRKQFMLKQLDLLKTEPSAQLPFQKQGSLNSILLNPSINNIPSGAQIRPNDGKHPSIIPNAPDLGSKNKIGALQAYPFTLEKRKSDNRKKKDPFGYRISILSLRNYSLKKAIKVKLIIYEQYYHQKDKGMKYQFATIYHDQTLDEKDPFNPHFKNKLDAEGAIAYNESFYVPENIQDLYNKSQKQIYLLLIVAEKDEKRITNEPKPYCWYSFKITHFGQIKQGRFTVSLYGDQIIYPYPADMNKMKKKKQEEITFQLEEVLLDEHMINQAKKSKNSVEPPQQPQQGSVPKQVSNPKIPSKQMFNPTQSGFQNPSIENNLKNNSKPTVSNPSGQSGQSGKNPSKSMNGSRVNMNYPVKMKNIQDDNAIKVNEQYFYSNQKTTEFSHVQIKKPLNFDVSVSALRTLPSYIGPVKLQMSFIDADGAHVLPKQEFLAEVGTDLYNPLVNYTRKIRNQSRLPPSTIIFIRMVALSALDYQVYSLGFSLLYLFFDKNGQTLTSNKINDYLMTSGYYQLPIYWGNIQPRYIDIEQLLQLYPPIPCASLLIGILENASKISNPMPAYSQKVYNTILFILDDNQAKLFSQQYKREPIDTNTMISGYLQYKGIKKNYSGEQINKYLFKSLTFSPQNTKTQLQLKWMAEYQQYFGINFVIDKLSLPQTELMYYYYVSICLSPPGNYYKSKNFDLKFCRSIDMDISTTKQIFFQDNQFFINPTYFKNSSIIVEVNRIQIFESENTQADNNIEGFAYLVIPVFEIQEKIRSANVMQAKWPLFQGDFDNNNIQKVQKNLPNFMDSNEKSKKSKAQLSFRILNGYFMNQFMPEGPSDDPKAKMYKDIPPQNMSFENALEDINSILSSNYNMQIT